MPDGLLKLCLNAVENKILNFLFLIIILSLSILVLIVNEKMGHISWDCVPSKDELYTHIRDRRDSIESDILLKSDNAVTVKLLEFQMIEVLSIQGKLCNQFTAVCNNVNTDYIITFISDRLAKTIHHRNHLRHLLYIFKSFQRKC